MPNFLDVRTLSFVASTISLILCICMIYVSRNRKTYNGFNQWTISSILYVCAFAMISMRDIVPDFFSVIVGNMLIIAGNIFIAYGLELFTNSSKKTRWFNLLTIPTFLLLIYFTYFSSNISARIILISFVIMLYYIYSAYLVIKHVPSILNNHNRFLVFTFSTQILWLILRIFQTVFTNNPIAGFMDASLFQGLTVTVFLSGNILTVVGLIVLNFQRVEFDWRLALKEIKTLRGLIPICSSCKSIRDDEGSWKQIETYIQKHSDAEFSHGICPDCLKKLYPELIDEEEESKLK